MFHADVMLFNMLGNFLISSGGKEESVSKQYPFLLKVREQNVRNPNTRVVMDAVFLYSGNVMVMKTVQTAVMKVLVVSNQNE